jgi:hypothetical protein
MKHRFMTAALLASTLSLSIACADTMTVGSVKISEMPVIRFGDTVEAVQQALHTSLEPEKDDQIGPPNLNANSKTHLRLKTRGIWVFFSNGKVYNVRLEAPFVGSVGGVKIGDLSDKVEKTFGPPVKRTNWGGLTGYQYYFDDVTTVRFMINRDGELETIFLEK